MKQLLLNKKKTLGQFILIKLLLSYIFSCAVSADEKKSPEELASALGVKLNSRPWHLANIWWDFENKIENFESLEIDITIDRDVPESYNLYIAPCGSAKINGMQFYGGIQTNINGWKNMRKGKRVHSGKGVIFSRWSRDQKTPIGLDHVQTVTKANLVESAGYEGEFASVRRPYQWEKGEYTWGITKSRSVQHKGQEATWFTCWIKDDQLGTRTEIGSLLFEGEDFTFDASMSAFVEVYATSKLPNSHIPEVNVGFGMPRINGKKIPLKAASAYYPKTVSEPHEPGPKERLSPDCANVIADGEQCIVKVGRIFRRDEKNRSHALNLK